MSPKGRENGIQELWSLHSTRASDKKLLALLTIYSFFWGAIHAFYYEKKLEIAQFAINFSTADRILSTEFWN